MKYLSFANRIIHSRCIEILMVIIDLSGSMDTDDWKPSRKAGAAEANRALIRVKAERYPKDQVGIIGFGNQARLLHEPVSLAVGEENLYRALESLPSMGWTNFKAALQLAEACLFGNSDYLQHKEESKSFSAILSNLLYGTPVSNSDHMRESTATPEALRIIMLTDGDYNKGGSPLKVAKRLKDAGVVIDCIGIGGSSEDVAEDKLKAIASRNPDGSVRYCFIGDRQDLIRKYESLAHNIRPV